MAIAVTPRRPDPLAVPQVAAGLQLGYSSPPCANGAVCHTDTVFWREAGGRAACTVFLPGGLGGEDARDGEN